ncbi:putative GPI anchored protein [Aspergillus coremiiformis]|uniref:Putative GPI anchored protein n=1 Tax=Aspergillus coremiiformis TaxID=138285 RepID=A0A5N6Z117_9EURO|nr:putative GPI anchored protein [Aspergillus coremiiformis]
MKLSILSLASLAPLVSAHFKLNYPASRGFDEDKMSQFPCGGVSQSSERTKISLSSGNFPVALSMGHAQTAVEVLLALGNDPGTNFNITLHPTFRVEGLGSFCLPNVAFQESVVGVKLKEGMNATLQVQSNGDPSGGLYACADIQFTNTGSSIPSCSNNTGVKATSFSGDAARRNANESTADGQAQSGSSSHSTTSHSTTSSTGHATSTGGAVSLETAAWGMLGAAVVGGIAIL